MNLSGFARSQRPVDMTTPNRGRGSRKCSRNPHASRRASTRFIERWTAGHAVLVEVYDDEEQSWAIVWDWYPNSPHASRLLVAHDYPGGRILRCDPCSWYDWTVRIDAPWSAEEIEREILRRQIDDILDEAGL